MGQINLLPDVLDLCPYGLYSNLKSDHSSVTPLSSPRDPAAPRQLWCLRKLKRDVEYGAMWCVASSGNGGEPWKTERPLGSYIPNILPFPSSANLESTALRQFCEGLWVLWNLVVCKYKILNYYFLFISPFKLSLHLLPHEILQRVGFQDPPLQSVFQILACCADIVGRFA